MEEILASIRRIISEESEPAAEPQNATSTVDQGSVDQIFADPEPAATHDDILELTEIVEDEAPVMDGSDDLTIEAAGDEPAPELDAHDVELAEDDQDFDLDDVADFAAEDAVPDFDPEPEPEMAAMTPPPSPRDPAPEPRQEDWADMVDPADEDEAIMTEASAAAVRDSFGQLSDLLVAGYAGSNKTLEGMVREMLRPMLKTWLDTNLPGIVERAVAREIARLARVKRP